MLITDKKQLKKYYSQNRLWQGIPSIEVTKKGRIFATFYSGGITEQIGNVSVVVISDDEGKTFGEPIAAAYLENHRCYDPCLWIDPLDRLWFTWGKGPKNATYGVICDNPDADELVWGEEFLIGEDVMMNKPTALSSGEWVFPIAVWKEPLICMQKYKEDKETGAFLYQTTDNGRSFRKLGGVCTWGRTYDEHMLLEMNNGAIRMYIRTKYGIAMSDSYDGGITWTEGKDSGLGGPDARFHIRRLKSGRILLINHYEFKGRNNLTALLSEDDGKTWKYKLLLDERSDVSYPDAKEADDGYIYIVYDRNRASGAETLDEAMTQTREIFLSRITEDDIINGSVGNGSFLKQTVSKLGEYKGADKNPYREFERYTDRELAQYLVGEFSKQDALTELLYKYSDVCFRINGETAELLDAKISDYEKTGSAESLEAVVAEIRSNPDRKQENSCETLIDRINEAVKGDLDKTLSTDEAAKAIGMSRFYIESVFEKYTCVALERYLEYFRSKENKK